MCTCFELISFSAFPIGVTSSPNLAQGMPRSEGDPHPFHFIRSPFFGLFRVGYANLVLINVHLAAGKKAARRELSTLNNLAEAIMGSNGRLLRRHLLGGRLKGRKPRGLVSVLGDFNCHLHVEKAPITTTTTTTITSPATTSTSTATTTATSTATTAASGGPGPVAESGHPQRQQRAGADPSSLAAITAAASRTSTLEDNDQNNDSDGGGNGSGGATGGVGGNGGNAPTMSNRSSWDVFLSNGWFNALCPQNSHGKPPPTNWRAQHLRDLDAICLKQAHGGLVKGSGVYALPPDVEPSQYPNHLLCWVLLDLEPLQGAPGKVRPLLQPAWPPGMAV
ncbi:hypothetical protein Vafri_8640 [Volvox africanus]|uniref:Endonuclease/exonuclease/phosphatase domain-containing protein n=1 Tax=Volvox africanus TaxID=51714 RepID=A0A8J4F1N1_9CHLO|nr:hypothetical protein Vafri_8640 [Volvox africanus]